MLQVDKIKRVLDGNSGYVARCKEKECAAKFAELQAIIEQLGADEASQKYKGMTRAK